jgi:hypothetical protein
MLFAMGVFLLGSILCGCAQNMGWLIAARSVQGLGGGGCLALTTIIISDMTSLRERPKYLAIGAFAWALGTNIGVSCIGPSSWLHEGHDFRATANLLRTGPRRRCPGRIQHLALGILAEHTDLRHLNDRCVLCSAACFRQVLVSNETRPARLPGYCSVRRSNDAATIWHHHRRSVQPMELSKDFGSTDTGGFWFGRIRLCSMEDLKGANGAA